MTSSTSSAFAPSSSSSSFATDSGGSNSHRLAVAGAVLGVFGIIGVGIILWWTIKMKPKVPYGEEAPSTPFPGQGNDNSAIGAGHGVVDALRRSLTLNRSLSNGLRRNESNELKRNKSLAGKITPFNPDTTIDSDGPRFVHTPGANMRIATRLSNGVWQFSEPLHPLAAASQASLLQTQNLESSRPRSPYLTPTSDPANPFSDANIYAPVRCESPAENPFEAGETNEREWEHGRQGTVDSHDSTTTTTIPKYPFTRPSALTLRTQTLSVVRGTVYDLQSLSSASAAVPTGIHDLDEDVLKNRGKPLPVAESELMRRGLRKESSFSAAGLFGSSSNLSLPLRQGSNDSYHVEQGLGRRPSAASAVLLGGTGPVGVSRNLSANAYNVNRTTKRTYHPDLDEVVDVRGDRVTDEEDEMDLTELPEETSQDAAANPVSSGVFGGASPYPVQMSNVLTSLEPGHDLPSDGSSAGNIFSHSSQPSTSTIATSSYPHTITTKGGSSSIGIGLANPYASTSTVYLGSLGHLMRPSVDNERPSEYREGQTTNPIASTNRGRPSLSIEPGYDKKGKRTSRNSTLATTYEGFEGENTLVYESPISPGGSYPYSPTSTSYTHDTRIQGKKKNRYHPKSSFSVSESLGYGYGYGYVYDRGNDHQLGLDDVYAAYAVSEEDYLKATMEGSDLTTTPEPGVVDSASGVEILDVPGVPPPAYLSSENRRVEVEGGVKVKIEGKQ